MKLKDLRKDRRGAGWLLWAIIGVLVVVVVIIAGLYITLVSGEQPPVDPKKAYGYIDYDIVLVGLMQIGGAISYDFLTPPQNFQFIRATYQEPATQSIFGWMSDGIDDLGWFSTETQIKVITTVNYPSGAKLILTSQQGMTFGTQGEVRVTFQPDVLIWCDTPGSYSITWEALRMDNGGQMVAQDSAFIVVPAK